MILDKEQLDDFLDEPPEGGSEAKPKRGNPLWAKGQSGNAAGRPKGSKNRLTLLREAVLEEAEELVLSNWASLVQKTIELANAGDATCLKILWDRIIPARKAIDGTTKDGADFGVKIVVQAMQPEIKEITIEGIVEETDT